MNQSVDITDGNLGRKAVVTSMCIDTWTRIKGVKQQIGLSIGDVHRSLKSPAGTSPYGFESAAPVCRDGILEGRRFTIKKKLRFHRERSVARVLILRSKAFTHVLPFLGIYFSIRHL